jgi:hypothetical protein
MIVSLIPEKPVAHDLTKQEAVDLATRLQGLINSIPEKYPNLRNEFVSEIRKLENEYGFKHKH